jgi:ATP-binding protein involved in chromosome partitioning
MSNQNKGMEKIDLPGVKNVILIASGKGGVGKSTVASNLAISFAREGYRTGLLDADLYGPSVPILFGIENERPGLRKEEDNDIMIPIEKYGVKIMSIGFLMEQKDAVIWRGPMASNALTQLLTFTDWGDLDYLVIDMPPGTGDINITLAQKLKNAMGVVVITPQKLAYSDGLKAANMFKNKALNIPVLGVVENMSYFIPVKHPEEKYYVFGNGGGEKLAENLKVPLLGEIPLIQDVSDSTDKGKNMFDSGNEMFIEVFKDLSFTIRKQIENHQPVDA